MFLNISAKFLRISTRTATGSRAGELTAIIYLSDPSPGASGGELRCHCIDEAARKRSRVDVEPTAGRLVLFRSRDLIHEVVPVRGWQRLAITAWFLLPEPRVAPPRAPVAPTGRGRVRVGGKPAPG